jgi:lysophospholipase L1-like esterase
MAIVALAAVSCRGSLELFVPADDEHLLYTGIWQHQGEAAEVHWQGSAVSLVFRGGSVGAVVEATHPGDQFRVVLDGVPAAKRLMLETGTREYELATGLDPQVIHHVTLFKETYSRAASRLHGFRIHGGRAQLRPATAEPSLRIAFFGDSNMDGTSLYSEKDSGDSGTYYAFPASVSRMLDAEMQLQAMGGARLAGTDTNTVTFFVHSPDGVVHDSAFRTGFEPDVIVVNAGANDIFGIDPAQRETHVKANFRRAVTTIRDAYGSAPHIVLMNAYGWDIDEPANYTEEVAAQIGGKLSVVHFPWMWEQWHGSMWEHSGQAYLLARHIASLDERWSIRRPHDFIDSFDSTGDVANGGFEVAAPFGSFGWRYKDDGVERIDDAANAREGRFYIRLDGGEQVHQGTDSTGDLLPNATRGGETYRVTAWMRSDSPGARGNIMTRFRSQQYGTHDDGTFAVQASGFALSPKWKRYVHTSTAEPGVWTTFHYLAAESGVVEIDDVSVEYIPSETRD